jgi:autotransporter-associated beta strand protein
VNGAGNEIADSLGLILADDVRMTGNQFGRLTIHGPIGGPGGLTKAGLCTIRLSADPRNSYQGDTQVLGGALELQSGGLLPDVSIPGRLVIGDTNGNFGAVMCLRPSQIASNAPVVMNGDSYFNLNGWDQTIGSLEMTASTVYGLGAMLTLNGNVTYHRSMEIGGSILNGGIGVDLNLNGVSRVFDVQADKLYLAETVSDGSAVAGIIKNGAGLLQLVTANTYRGLTTVNAGRLQVDHDGALGLGGNGMASTTVEQGAQLILMNGVDIANETLQFFSTGPGNVGGLYGVGTCSWNGPVILFANSAVGVTNNGVLSMNGLISGPGSFTKTGAGTLRLGGLQANSFAGGAFHNAGLLMLTKTNDALAIPAGNFTIGDGLGGAEADEVRYLADYKQISIACHVHINSSGLLNLNGYPEGVGSLSGTGAVKLGVGATLGAGSDNTDFTFDGLISGTGSFSKMGTGIATLTANSSFTGFALVSGGTLRVNGTLINADATLFNSSTLIGSGQVRSVVARANTTVSPGTGPGQLSVSQGVTFEPGSIFKVELNGMQAGVTYDQIAMNGVLNVTNATLSVTAGFNSTAGNTFLLINNYGAGAVNGTFANLSQNALLTIDGAQYRISYTGASGNDVLLTRANTAPTLNPLAAPAPAAEGANCTLTGTINEPDTGDAVRLVINWGDGTPNQTNSFTGPNPAFNVAHQYRDDNPTGSPQDNYTINAWVLSAEGAMSPTRTTQSTVTNVPPNIYPGAAVGLPAGSPLTNTITLADPGTDSFTAYVNYGDGSPLATISAGTNKWFALDHTYASNGTYTVTMLVRDDDNGERMTTLTVLVGLKLEVQQSGANQVALSWSTAFPGLLLLTSPTITGTNWVNVLAPRVETADHYVIKLPATNEAAFYRLYRP